MSPTLARPRFAPPLNVGANLLIGAAVAVVLLVAVLIEPEMRLPGFVSRVTVANPTDYGLDLEVAGGDRDGWLALGRFPRQSSRPIYEVIDSGRRWVFRFRFQGEVVGEMAVSRVALERGRWRFTVPSEVGERMAAAGFSETAR